MADEQPIIIKKKKKGGHGGHHGGAWKVAYADFVTAMMAFFLVMWILGLNPDSKKKIASFFKDPGVFSFTGGKKIPVDLELQAGSQGNEGNGNGTDSRESAHQALIDSIQAHRQEIADTLMQAIKEQAVKDSIEIAQKVESTAEQIKEQLRDFAKDKPEVQQLLDNLQMTLSKDGLRIEMVESSENVFFMSGSAGLRKEAVELLKRLGREMAKLNNTIEIEGHTDSKQYSRKVGYSNWELSSDRAHAARRILESSGMWSGQITNVTGYADRKLRNARNPFDVQNRRVSILIANKTTATLVDEAVDHAKKAHEESHNETKNGETKSDNHGH